MMMISSLCLCFQVEVIDVNENLASPQFDRLVYNSSISESAVPGQRVLKVHAVDSDTGAADSKVSYSIHRGSGLGRFSVESNTGESYFVGVVVTININTLILIICFSVS